MSLFDDICSVGFPKEWRMAWARAFIKAWLTDPELQKLTWLSLDSLTSQANDWRLRTRNPRQLVPIISSEDIRESMNEIINGEEVSVQ
jgi:hypothetical protein